VSRRQQLSGFQLDTLVVIIIGVGSVAFGLGTVFVRILRRMVESSTDRIVAAIQGKELPVIERDENKVLGI
jgi:hypothetical protein